MTYVDWKIKTRRLAACSCDYGCQWRVQRQADARTRRRREAFEIVEG